MIKSKKNVLVVFLLLLICIYTIIVSNKHVYKSKTLLENVTDTTLDDFFVVCKLWGFLKYYHPIISSGKYEWDCELFYILNKVVNVSGKHDRNELLNNWINSFGDLNKLLNVRRFNYDSCQIKLKPSLDWIYDSDELGYGLSNTLIKLSEYRSELLSCNYVQFVKGVGNPIFMNENKYENIDYNDKKYFLLSLFRFWNIIEYFYPYKYLIDENWDDVLKKNIKSMLNVENKEDYENVCVKMVALLNDSHAKVFFAKSLSPKKNIPICLKYSNGNICVIDKLGDETRLNVGDIITKINDVSIADLIQKYRQVISSSNDSYFYNRLVYELVKSNNDSVSVEFMHEGITLKDTLKCFDYKISCNLCLKEDIYGFISNDIGYVNLCNVSKKKLREVMSEMGKTKYLILDLRGYPSEFILYDLLKYLLPQPVSFAKITYTTLEYPGLFLYSSPLYVGEVNNYNCYTGELIVLINENTISQAEFTTMALISTRKVVLVGGQTAGADGNVSDFYLPGDVKITITGIGVYFPDGEETQRVGILPDIYIVPPLNEIRKNDYVLEKVINMINTKQYE